jgi:hypothetical protein
VKPDLKLDGSCEEIAFLGQEGRCGWKVSDTVVIVHGPQIRKLKRMVDVPPIVGSLFSWKSLLTNRRTSEDYWKFRESASVQQHIMR